LLSDESASWSITARNRHPSATESAARSRPLNRRASHVAHPTQPTQSTSEQRLRPEDYRFLQSGSEREMAQKLTSDIDRVRCLSRVISAVSTSASNDRSTPINGHQQTGLFGPVGAAKTRHEKSTLAALLTEHIGIGGCGGLLGGNPIPRTKSAKWARMVYRAGARMDAGWPGSFSLGPTSVSLPPARSNTCRSFSK
jgi:hypothetical protein